MFLTVNPFTFWCRVIFISSICVVYLGVDAKHWHQRWENNEIGFHEGDVNRYLDQYFTNLNLQQGDTVFVPLCGKTHDIHYLLAQGMCVVGAEFLVRLPLSSYLMS